ncbi:MAG: patatin-like phospholipase family protein [Thermoanaerobaculia bacterium]|jgi:NTE family protein|nr:patatin-like phospholipase family protein [Thermoanaerobaculia bacterium]
MRYRLGIVLSGGGSRGLAHAGVLRALAENGIEPDCIAGTSAGALVGALHAAGRDCTEILQFFDDANPFRLSRLALGKPGFIDSEKIVGSFARWFPEDSFAALSRPLFVTGTDLVSGRLQVWSSGPLVRPLLASSAVPFVISPTRVEGRLYIDGGIVNNFPVEPLFGLCDAILGVHATPLSARSEGELSSTFAVTQRALEIGMFHASRRKFHHADLVISPAGLGRFSTFDIKRHAEIVEVGYRATLEQLDAVRALL